MDIITSFPSVMIDAYHRVEPAVGPLVLLAVLLVGWGLLMTLGWRKS